MDDTNVAYLKIKKEIDEMITFNCVNVVNQLPNYYGMHFYSIKFIVYENKLVQKILKLNKNSYLYTPILKDNSLNINS